MSLSYGERVFGTGVFGGSEALEVSAVRIIAYRISPSVWRQASLGYGERAFGEGVFGGREWVVENEAIRVTPYRFTSVLRKESDILYNWGIRVEEERNISYRYKSLIPFVADIPYRFTLRTSNIKTVSYNYKGITTKDVTIPYSYISYIAKTALIRYSYLSLTSIYKGTVRKITITATPSGQIARIELERR